MAKVTTVQQNFDNDLADVGKVRVSVPETVQLPNGSLATVYREKIVKASTLNVTPLIMKKGRRKMDSSTTEVKAVKAREARTGTKLERVVAFVKDGPSKSKAEMIAGIVEMLDVTPSNANVYLYKALKQV